MLSGSDGVTVVLPLVQALDTYGCASKLVELGIKGSGLSFGDRTSTIFKAEFSCISPYTKFPFILTLAQTVTEHVLEERLNELGVNVIRPYRAVGMKVGVGGKGIDVTFESGETVKAEYVIGADGARSTVSISIGF